jgi:hypothetical protein
MLPEAVAMAEDVAEALLALHSASLSLKDWYPILKAQKDKK